MADVVRVLHRIVAFGTVPTAVAAAVLLVLPWTPNRQTHDVGAGPAPWVGPAAGAGLVLAALAGLFTGGLLPWDELGLFHTLVGADLRGYQFLHDGSARFVLLGGQEVGTGELARTLVLHTTVLAAAIAILLGVARVAASAASRAFTTAKP